MVKRRLLACLVLVCAVVVAQSTVLLLNGQEGQVPDQTVPYYLAFCTALGLAIGAGALAPRPQIPDQERELGSLPSRNLRSVLPRLLAAIAAVGFLAWTWILQGRADPPLTCLLTWIAGMIAAALAFPTAWREESAVKSPPKWSLGRLAALSVVIALAGTARLVRLDAVLPVFSGDEASVAMDGEMLLRGHPRPDLFGTGTLSAMHMAMLPAGVGVLLHGRTLGSARFPYAVVGTAAVVATAAAASVVAGPWAALAAASLIAFSPIHVHFSRSSNTVILDSLTVTIAVLFLLSLFRRGSPRDGCMAGIFAGLSLYGYGGGRVMPVALMLSLPIVLWRFRRPRSRAPWLLIAILFGFAIASAPTLRFAAEHFQEWNGRFNQASVFAPDWRQAEIARLGSASRLLAHQVRLGTLGLLSAPPLIDIFTGYPLIAPALLPALGVVGLGWLLGRRRFGEAAVLALVVGGNVAGVVLTVSTPQAHRASSLVPMLAILGGVAVAGFLELLPEKAAGIAWRSALAALLVGALLARQAPGFPLDWEGYADAGGRHAAFAQASSRFLGAPRTRTEPLFLHGEPFLFWDFPSFSYFLPERSAQDAEGVPQSLSSGRLPNGIHLFCEENAESAAKWAAAVGLRAIRLPHPAYPTRDTGLVILVHQP